MNKNTRRQALIARKKRLLPLAYTQVEYLENTGTQWINTGVFATLDKMEIEIELEKIEHKYGNYWFSNGRTQFNLQFVGLNSKSTINVTTDSSGYGIVKVNGLIKYEHNWGKDFTNIFIALFNLGKDDKTYYYQATDIVKLFNCKIKVNDELVRNLIPCYRKSDHKPGMYDIVNGVFYTNQGTGEFILGPKV